jgi:hypothetical protein
MFQFVLRNEGRKKNDVYGCKGRYKEIGRKCEWIAGCKHKNGRTSTGGPIDMMTIIIIMSMEVRQRI